MGRKLVGALLSLIGGAIGAFLGVVLFGWIKQQGYYAPVIPGAALGLVCHLASLEHSKTRGAICGVASVFLGYFTEWWYWPGQFDGGFSHLSENLRDLGALTHLMIAIGAVVAFWWGREASPWRSRFPMKKVDF